jgi:hypothetical protein
MLKKIKYILIAFLVTFESVAFGAEGRYTPLAPLPYTTSGGKAELGGYMQGLFKLLIGAGAVLAFLYIFWYGFEYMFSDSFLKKSNAKDRILQIFGGLGLIILSYVLLWNINPTFLDMTLHLKAPNTKLNTVDITAVPASPSVIPSGLPGGVGAGIPACGTSGCVGLPTAANLTVKNGSYISTSMQGSLASLADSMQKSNLPWTITEAMPPSQTHQNPCHQNGTCIDAVVNDPTIENLNTFISNARSSGLAPIYEVTTQTQKDNLIKSGIPCDRILVESKITGPHFSVYTPTSCAATPSACSGSCPR